MSGLFQLIRQSIYYHWRMHLGLMVGTLIACVVLTGALVVGDSVRQTLRGIATARLGEATHALDWGNRYFDAGLAAAIQAEAPETTVAAALALRGIAELPPEHPDPPGRVNRAWVYGVDHHFWRLAPEGTDVPMPGVQEALINEAVAQALSLEAGDEFILRVPRPSSMPLDAPLARGGDSDTAVARMQVLAILTESQWGRFSLSTDQAMPNNVYVDRDWLGSLVELPDKANILLAGEQGDTNRLNEALSAVWRPEALGYQTRTHDSGVVQLESERLFMEDVTACAAAQAGASMPTLTYLVNSIRSGDRATPYSFVTAGPVPEDTPADGVCINQWLADMLDIGAGDSVTITWSEPLPSGAFAERQAEALVHRVIPMDALHLERALAPRFPGLSDVDSCRDWDVGLPLDDDKLLDEANEAYWEAYGQTPKLMAPYALGSDWWGSRFGSIMAVRFPKDSVNADEVTRTLREALDPAALGLVFLPVREDALQAVEGALDFGALFLGMSAFLIVAALSLLALLYTHGLQTRAGEMGTLLAVGWPRKRVQLWLLLESLPTILVGTLAATLLGALYARLLLYGLVRFWPDAVAGTPLRFHATPTALLQGAIAAIVCVLLVIAHYAWRAGRRPARELLQRDFASLPTLHGRRDLVFYVVLVLSIPLLAGAAYQALYTDSRNPAAWFFLSGASALAALLSGYALVLGYMTRRAAPRRPRLWRLALSHLARRRSRSLGVAAVTGCGVFLVLSVTAMQATMTFEPDQRSSGTGGFSVFATTTVALRSGESRPLGFSRDAIVPLRLWDGDDAGCLNLNQARQPRLLGVDPDILTEWQAFAPEEDVAALWALLGEPLEDDVVPALVGDTDTAMWGLQATTDPERGSEITYRDDWGNTFRVRTVGRLPMRLSLFQGALLISEDQFTRVFPHEGGYRAFLLDTPDAEETAARLNRNHGRLGMEAMPSVQRLRAFHAVERAYLAMFLILGGLGMMLGAGGAAIIVLRNLSERRAEFALFVALGYPRATIRRMALLENGGLTLAGLVFGVVAAALATVPVLLEAQVAANHSTLIVVIAAVFVFYLAASMLTTTLFLLRIPLAALRTE